jgi:hypothetical protein
MKTSIASISLALVTIVTIATTSVNAQDANANSKTVVSVETDPSTFAFGGYALHLRIKPKSSKHLVIGAGTYALDLPAVMVDMNMKNKDKGWNVRINSAYSLFGEYYFSEANRKWFLGVQAGVQNYKNSNSGTERQEMKYSSLVLMPSVGYNWYPFSIPLYIKPWAGLGYTAKISGSNLIDGSEYDISPIIPFATLHVGYLLNR